MTDTSGSAAGLDFGKISKAIAAGIGGAVATAGGTGFAYFSIPPEQLANLPHWVSGGVIAVSALCAFVVTFTATYLAPPNTPDGHTVVVAHPADGSAPTVAVVKAPATNTTIQVLQPPPSPKPAN